MATKRKKYNPKAKMQSAAALRENRNFKNLLPLQAEAEKYHEFELTFEHGEMAKKISESMGCAKDAGGDSLVDFPTDLLCKAFDYNPLIMAITLGLIELPDYWDVQFEISYLDINRPELGYKTVFYENKLPQMTLSQVLFGNTSKFGEKVYIVDEHGFKTAWMGLNKAAEKLTSKSSIPDTYQHVLSNVYVAAYAKFKDTLSYRTFLNLKKLQEKNDGSLDRVLRQVWLDEVAILKSKEGCAA